MENDDIVEIFVEFKLNLQIVWIFDIKMKLFELISDGTARIR